MYLSATYLLDDDQLPWAANGLLGRRVCAAAAAAGGVLIGEDRSRRAVTTMLLELEGGGSISLYL
jgi:hypothetical protein